MNELLENAPAWVKALAAAAAGRCLLLLKAQRGTTPLSWHAVLTVLLYEVPLIAAFALLGWHAAALLQFDSENMRIVFTTLLAHVGARGIDALVSRVLLAKVGRTG